MGLFGRSIEAMARDQDVRALGACPKRVCRPAFKTVRVGHASA